MTKVTWNGREVYNAYGRVAVMLFVMISIPVGLVITFCVLLPISLIISTLLHIPLRLIGRRGMFRTEGNSFVIKLDRKAFERV